MCAFCQQLGLPICSIASEACVDAFKQTATQVALYSTPVVGGIAYSVRKVVNNSIKRKKRSKVLNIYN